jgi:carbamoyltransferase
MKILGISAYYHDSSACLLVEGNIIAAAQEERFSRIKHDESFPINAIKYCLKESSLSINDIDYIVYYDKPFLKFERILETYLAFAPYGLKNFIISFPEWIKKKLFLKRLLVKEFFKIDSSDNDVSSKLLFSEHHLSHACSAFFPSPFINAAVLTMDGVGEWTTSSLSIGSENKLKRIKEIRFPHSLGLFYSAFTYYLGFKVNSGEYKLMGLAPYGRPIYVDLIKDNLIDTKDDGSFRLNMDYFSYCITAKMVNKKFTLLFNNPCRTQESEITQFHMDIAASLQLITEEIIIKIAKNILFETGLKNICLSGGVALNCVANGKLYNEKLFEGIWIQPASGDAGGAIGAALAVYYIMLNKPRIINSNDSMNNAYLGPKYEQNEIERQLVQVGAKFKTYKQADMIDVAVKGLNSGKAIGWHQGRMEFGPRALGARSIIADARSPKMQKQLNLKIKFRESFRPFAPSVLSEYVSDWFEFKGKSPYMLFVAKVKADKLIESKISEFGLNQVNIIRSQIPAVTHIDNTSRIQTVCKESNQLFHSLLSHFYSVTGCPMVINTSFNIRGEPIVNSPMDAFKCFMGTDIDMLIIGNCVLIKEDQNESLKINYVDKFKLD